MSSSRNEAEEAASMGDNPVPRRSQEQDESDGDSDQDFLMTKEERFSHLLLFRSIEPITSRRRLPRHQRRLPKLWGMRRRNTYEATPTDEHLRRARVRISQHYFEKDTPPIRSQNPYDICDIDELIDHKIPKRRAKKITKMPDPNAEAEKVAIRVTNFARTIRNIHEEELSCLDCGLLPTERPVTGVCGHTRCAKCAEKSSTCPCGRNTKTPLSVNVLIREAIANTTGNESISSSDIYRSAVPSMSSNNILLTPDHDAPRPERRVTRRSAALPYRRELERSIPMTARSRFNHALNLIHGGKHREAAPYLALAASSTEPDLRIARTVLSQVVMILSGKDDPRPLTREINQLIRKLTATSWIKTADFECILCYDLLTKPVTTPCGHVFCRTCLEKTLDYSRRCPLCLRDLTYFQLSETGNTLFVQSALASINKINTPMFALSGEYVPIFVCTAAFPSIPCPLFVFDPRYWLMVRRVLQSSTRRFGMVALDKEKEYADYGTILEVRDCVHLEDGRSILTTVGVSRFKVLERIMNDGYEMARVKAIRDVQPVEDVHLHDLKFLSTQIIVKALIWLRQLNCDTLNDIENTFGSLSNLAFNTPRWWESHDGPTWLWWLVAILPLRTEIKVLILSTDILLKRMTAVSRTLDAVSRIKCYPAANYGPSPSSGMSFQSTEFLNTYLFPGRNAFPNPQSRSTQSESEPPQFQPPPIDFSHFPRSQFAPEQFQPIQFDRSQYRPMQSPYSQFDSSLTPRMHFLLSQYLQANFPQMQFPPMEFPPTELPPPDYIPPEYAPPEYAPPEYAPEDNGPQYYGPADYWPAEYEPAYYSPADYEPGDYAQANYSPAEHAYSTYSGYPPSQ